MAWARVAGTSASSVSGANPASWTVTTGGVTTLNNRLILCVEFTTTGTVRTSSITDDKGNTWTKDAHREKINGTFTDVDEVWSTRVTTAGTTIVTCTFSSALSGGAGTALAVEEYSGLSTAANAVDVSVGTDGSSTSPSSGATAATTAANELVVGQYGDDDGPTSTFTAGAGFTKHAAIDASNIGNVSEEDKDSGLSGTTQTADGTASVSKVWVMHCVVYKLAAAVAAETPSYAIGRS